MKLPTNIPASKEQVEQIEPSALDRETWAKMAAVDQPVTVTLTSHQWAVVIASIRVSMGFSPKPGIGRLAHDALHKAVRDQLPGDPSGN